jgi:polysaccharide biosynthesis protein PslH
MRILVLSDKVLSRKLGDGLRVHGLLEPLADRHHFDLICFARPGEDLEPELRRVFRSVTLVPAPTTQRASLVRRAFKSISAEDFKLTSAAMQSAVAEALGSEAYDLILEEAANTIPNLPEGPLSVPLVVDSIDEPILREMRALRHAAWSAKPEHFYRAWRFWRYERALLGRAALNIYVSEVDAQVYMRLFPQRRTAVVPNGVDTTYFAPMPLSPEPACIVFEGNMNFEPNIDTAEVLVRDVLPRVVKRIPDARVVLVGRNPGDGVRALASERVEVTGTVEDVRPYLARATVFACPMRLGSGIKNKILQAWSMGRPVVAAPESLGGLNAKDEFNILVRESPAAFADAVVELILDQHRAMQLGERGRATAEREYSWQIRARQLEMHFQELADSVSIATRHNEVVNAGGKLGNSDSARGTA